MKTIRLALFAMLLPLSAHAGSAADPVQRIVDIAESRWKTESSGADYFENLKRDFSRSFGENYRAASKYPAYDGGDSPFDYDVITSSQDGCPLKDIKIDAGTEKAGITPVSVQFRLWDCADDAATKAKISKVRFDVVTEKGKPVIADIHRLGDGDKWDSLVAEMQEIVKAGQTPQ
jgi:hypothetical protein